MLHSAITALQFRTISSLRKNRLAAVVLRRLWTRMSTTFRSVDGAAKIVLLAADPDEHLVRVPRVARLWAAELQHIGEDPAEAQAHSRMLS
jgi:hypothetical protein